MTLLEAAHKYQYDISICFGDTGWYWDINGGYSSVGGHNEYPTPTEAYEELMRFLETFEPFEK